jgi:hypothetical protein
MKIAPTKHTPLVDVDEKDWKVLISGVSIPENAYMHFKPLEDLLNTLTPEKVEQVSFTFRLEYMNTLSSKAFLDYLRTVKDQKQIPISVMWEYFSDDEEMRDHGETFSEIMDIPFNYRAVDPENRRDNRR